MITITSATALAAQVAELLPAATESVKVELVQQLMKKYLFSKSEDWKKYSFFSNIHYTRNLVYEDENVEVMVRPFY